MKTDKTFLIGSCLTLIRSVILIVSFCREIDGIVYPGIVKEKQAAKKTYDKAKKKGQSAGHIFYKFV